MQDVMSQATNGCNPLKAPITPHGFMLFNGFKLNQQQTTILKIQNTILP